MSVIQVKATLKPHPPYVTTDAENKIAPGTPVRINVPEELAIMAMTYPSLDWNEIMRYAVRAITAPCNVDI